MTPVQIALEKTKHLPGQMLRQFVLDHPASKHSLFQRLKQGNLTKDGAGALLRNYDAHASHLRRLLLKAATIMPEAAVGHILENVRNEYGNGKACDRHQLQLQDLAWSIGVGEDQYNKFAIKPGIKTFIKDVTAFYYPLARQSGSPPYFGQVVKSRAAVAAGAITSTELLALEEFKCLQIAFRCYGQEHHIWFDHVAIECDHLEDSVSLALYFLTEDRALEADVLLGMKGVLDATVHLYDGLLACLN
jgi:hypothetical protein